jgi:hypothetical protein
MMSSHFLSWTAMSLLKLPRANPPISPEVPPLQSNAPVPRCACSSTRTPGMNACNPQAEVSRFCVPILWRFGNRLLSSEPRHHPIPISLQLQPFMHIQVRVREREYLGCTHVCPTNLIQVYFVGLRRSQTLFQPIPFFRGTFKVTTAIMLPVCESNQTQQCSEVGAEINLTLPSPNHSRGPR